MDAQLLIIASSGILLSFVVELCAYVFVWAWQNRKIFAIIALILVFFGTGILLASGQFFVAYAAMVLCVFRGFSLLRLVENRTTAEHLKEAGFKSLTYFFILQGLLLVFAGLDISPHLDILVYFSTLLSVIFAVGTIVNLKSSTFKNGALAADSELPSVSIAIPARNETDTLAACLDAALLSDYPKLEILVLDDCSQDKTAEIIKSYAHDGVRFIHGEPTPESWLSKNFAYDQLLKQASAKYVLFIGVDIRLHTTSVRALVQAAVTQDKQMVSILPRRTKSGLAASVVQPMRYWWELAIPKKLKKWPPVLSSCWLIERSAAHKLGGFESVKRAILPERHFAKDLGNKYAFWRTDTTSLITTHKDFNSQWNTAMRTRYPQLHRRPELVAIQALSIYSLLLLPFLALFAVNRATLLVSIMTIIILVTTHLYINLLTNKIAAWFALFNFPFVLLIDFAALFVSLYSYEFSEVEWKGRNVCIPVMKVVPKLPNP